MKKKKIIFLSAQVISNRDYKRLGLEGIEISCELTIFDFTKIMQPKAFNNQLKNKKEGIKNIFIEKLSDLIDLKGLLEQSDLIISALDSPSPFNSSIYELFQKYQQKLCLLKITSFPLEPLGLKYFFFKKIYCKIISEKIDFPINTYRRLLFKIKNPINKKINLKPKYLMVCGESVLENCKNMIEQKTIIIKSCSYDYILSQNCIEKKLDFKYVVFLDEYLINHSDFKILNNPVEKEEIYYKELNKFFEFIETSLKLKVVIASHPRADLNYNKNKFPKNLVFQNNTCQLIKNCEACIIHASTSINFAVIHKKPTLFITTNRMKMTRYDNDLLASWFNKKPLNISAKYNLIDIKNGLNIEKKYFEQYLKKFIRFSTEPIFGYEFLINKFIK